MNLFPFSALLARMKYITRWSLMHAARPESLAEHAADTALLAHMLCLISLRVLHTPAEEVRPDKVAAAALYHDAPEILTGDLPTPVKYKNTRLRMAYKALEAESVEQMLSLVPPALRQDLSGCLRGSELTQRERTLLKAADRLSAIIKCLEEGQTGNREFDAALDQLRAALHAMECPEAEYFVQTMLPCYTLNLDELTHFED